MKRNHIWIGIILLVVLSVAITVEIGATQNSGLQDSIEAVVKQAELLSISQSCVVDAHGNLREDCVAEYEAQLREVFSEKSGYIAQNSQIMQAIVRSFDASTDVVLESQITDFQVRDLTVDDHTATMTCDVGIVQKYIPCLEEGRYRFLFAATTETKTYTLEKEDGAWRVLRVDSDQYDFGSPKEMGLTSEDYEKEFPTREAACEYAASLSIDKLFRSGERG